MKQNIEWHKECFINRKSLVEKYEKELYSLQKRINDNIKYNKFYEYQIDSAIKDNHKNFDRSRYKIKNKGD